MYIFAYGMPKGIYKRTKEHNEKIRQWHLKNSPRGFLGKHHTQEFKQRFSMRMIGKNNPNWNGYNAKLTNSGLHQWVRKHLARPEKCQICNKNPPRDLANVTGIYNRDFINWRWLCHSCHIKLDFKRGIRNTSNALRRFRHERMLNNFNGITRKNPLILSILKN